MSGPMLALIFPLGADAHPEHPIAPGGPPPGIWPSPGYPAHPIAPGGPPPGVWPSPPPVGIWPSPGYPAHPIAPGGPPPGVWPPAGVPTPPIYYPPVGVWPGPGVPTPPIYYPPGVNVPTFPTHPIAPGGPPPGVWPPKPPGDGDEGGDWAFSPVYGWVWVPEAGGGKPKPPDVPVDPNAPVVNPLKK